MTYAMIGLNCLVYIVMMFWGVSPFDPDAEALLRWGVRHGPSIFEGDWWRLATSLFVHIGLLHLVFNMFVLWYVGRELEPLFGGISLGLLYLYSGVVAGMLGVLQEPEVVSAGASGAIFGIFGGSLGYLLFNHRRVPSRIRVFLVTFVLPLALLTLLIGILVDGIDNLAHGVGLVTGLCLGVLMSVTPPGHRFGLTWHRVLLMSCATGLVLAVSLLFSVRVRDITLEEKTCSSCEPPWFRRQPGVETGEADRLMPSGSHGLVAFLPGSMDGLDRVPTRPTYLRP